MAKVIGVQLSDLFLISLCLDRIEELGFVTNGTKLLVERVFRAGQPYKNKVKARTFLNTVPEDLDDLWANLLMDAIHTLKLHDRREKAWQRNFMGKSNGDRISEAREQNVYGITDLRKYFDAFTEYERVLYGAEDTYRDHVVHVFRTWLIGVYLMTVYEANIQELAIVIPPLDNEDDVPEAFAVLCDEERWAMWTIVSLCHDLGYPLEKTHKINDVIEGMLSHFGNIVTSRHYYSFQTQHQSINDITLRILSSKIVELEPPGFVEDKHGRFNHDPSSPGRYITKLQAKYHAKFSRSLEAFRHGIISCLVLMKTLVFFLETDYDGGPRETLTYEDSRQFCVRREILRAIAAHTCTDVYHLQINTLAFMLIICDELQEWGRPTFSDMKLGRVGPSQSAKVFIEECNFATGEFRAVVEYTSTTPTKMKNRLRRKFQDFHKLMRAALDDETRKVKFQWKVVVNNTETYLYKYNSSAGPFAEFKASEDNKTWELYSK